MSEEALKEHRLYLTVSTNPEYKTENVAKLVQDLLIDLQDEDGPFEEVSASMDPINEDTEMPDAVEGTLTLLDIYTGFLREKTEDDNMLEFFRAGIEKLEHGVTDLKACVRCIKLFSSQMQEGPQIKIMQGNLEDAPYEVLHALAHKMGLEPSQCATMDRDDLVNWLREKMDPPRTIN